MKKQLRSILSVTLCLVMLLGSVGVGFGGFADLLEAVSVKASALNYADGTGSNDGWVDSTRLRLGSYPQTDVTSSMGKQLNSLVKEWKSYRYYEGPILSADKYKPGACHECDCMFYCDIKVGNDKYRGVKINTYRTIDTNICESTHESLNHQAENGYECGNIYWFRYEPLTWIVLGLFNSTEALVMCESVIDSQPFENVLVNDRQGYVYSTSSIRQWLNNDFLNTAFTEEQLEKILNYYEDDKVFLLSKDEAENPQNYTIQMCPYAERPSTVRPATDYAYSQGLYDGPEWANDNSPWRCRDGYILGGKSGRGTINSTCDGVVPGLKLKLTPEIHSTEAGNYDICCSEGEGSNDGWIDSTHLRLGSYPQTDVTEEMGEVLNALATDWKSYKYYERDRFDYKENDEGNYDGQMYPSDYMLYCDVKIGNDKYRGVTFSAYRNYTVINYLDNVYAGKSYGYLHNGFLAGTIYWFKYEPLVWRVLDKDAGLVMCESIIDAQSFNSYWYFDSEINGSIYSYGNAEHTFRANDYYNSSIREWLTHNFYNTAFSESQQRMLLDNECDNSCSSPESPEYYRQDSKDKVFLLSFDEVNNSAYGFDPDPKAKDPARVGYGTDYAVCQGLFVSDDSFFAAWWTRTADYNHAYASCRVTFNGNTLSSSGDIESSWTVNLFGVRPALKLNLKSEVTLDDNGGTGESEKHEVDNFTTFCPDCPFTNGSLNFCGWYLDDDCTQPWTKTDKVTENMTLYAGWTEYKAGDIIELGSYPQSQITDLIGLTENTDYVKFFDEGIEEEFYYTIEPVQWIVLDPATGLCISRYAIDAKEFDSRGRDIYSNSDIRNRLYGATGEGEFFTSTFTDAEKAVIKSVKIDDTMTDKVFLLSEDEAETYFADDNARICTPTAYVRGMGARCNENYNSCTWWLRTPGCDDGYASVVDVNGSILLFPGEEVDHGSVTVRPALYLNLKSISKETVTFNANGHGTAPKTREVLKGDKVQKPADPTADGYVFGGWFRESTCENAWNFDTDTVTEATTLYAKWALKYTVTFDVQGHGTAPEAQIVAAGDHAQKPTPAPTTDGWTFVNWFTEPACINQWHFNNDPVNADITLYAKWTKNGEDPGGDNPEVTYNLPNFAEKPAAYRTDVTVSFALTNLPEGAEVYIDGKKVDANNGRYSKDLGQLTSDTSVKIEVKKDGRVLDSKDAKITVDSGFFAKIASFFSNFLFNGFKWKKNTINF